MNDPDDDHMPTMELPSQGQLRSKMEVGMSQCLVERTQKIANTYTHEYIH